MSIRIEDYALIGDCSSGALVSRDGSIDWLCLPRFDSGACFASLLGTCDHGRWQICPSGQYQVDRRYREDTLILETEFTTPEGSLVVIDFMPPRTAHPDLVRMVVGKTGRVKMHFEFVIRPDYGSLIPWVRRVDGGIRAIAGPDGFQLTSDVELHGENFKTVAEFDVEAGETKSFVMTWFPSHSTPPRPIDPMQALTETEKWWQRWARKCDYTGRWRDAVMRSLITLKGLTYGPTGGIVAALTTSLPECLGGSRNWDYRYCWPRDATFTLFALLQSGYVLEATAWRNWLLRTVAGRPEQMQSIYGVAGEHRLPEQELPWLPGYENSAPVRIGNGAFAQLQIDVYGEIMATFYLAYKKRLPTDDDSWPVQRVLMEHLEKIWSEPDEGIWEIRGPRHHFTHSKVLAWVAADRAVKTIELLQLDEPIERWANLRDAIHADVCQQGFDRELNSFVQSYGSKHLDASLLLLPLVGFLPPSDPRIVGTLDAVQRVLMADGLVRRYDTESGIDGLDPGEGRFLLCSFWLVDNLTQQGRLSEAQQLFEQLLSLQNDVGLLSEEYDPASKRLVGNFPQALSHVALINSAQNLSAALQHTDGIHKSYEQGR